MLDINITIRGPGGCINFESIMIERLFKDLGYNVIVDNDYPFIEQNSASHAISETEDEFIERVKQSKNIGNINIHLKVDHCPWGG